MKLVVKFNLVFLAIFAIGLTVAGIVSSGLLHDNARDETLSNARIMMESALATRSYTTKHIQPLLADELDERFLPESVPAFAATEKFNTMRATYPDFTYKEATLNPTNPRDKAADWEVAVIGRLRDESAARREVIGERDTESSRSLYLGAPDTHQRSGLPHVSQHAGGGARDDDRQVRPRQPSVAKRAKARATSRVAAALVERAAVNLARHLGPIAQLLAKKLAPQAKDDEDFVRLMAEQLEPGERQAYVESLDRGA